MHNSSRGKTELNRHEYRESVGLPYVAKPDRNDTMVVGVYSGLFMKTDLTDARFYVPTDASFTPPSLLMVFEELVRRKSSAKFFST
jgi:hypothetical protein